MGKFSIKVKLICPNCKNDFFVLPHDSKKRKYCSKNCWLKSNKHKKEMSEISLKNHKNGLCKPQTTHGISKTSIYKLYSSIKNRCYNTKNKDYKYYGKKGISMCELWISKPFCFYVWCIDNGYVNGLTIDRIDNNNNYSPENCRFITIQNQQRNKSTNIKFENKTISEWAILLNKKASIIYKRLKNGYDIKDAIFR